MTYTVDRAKDMTRYAGSLGLILSLAFAAVLVRLYWTNEIGTRLYWVGAGLFFSAVVGSLAVHRHFAQKAADRDDFRGFEVLQDEDDDTK